MDNAPFHTAQDLEIPTNIIRLFQPPYCPELNPIKAREYIKYEVRSSLFINLEDLKIKVANTQNSLSQEIIRSLAGWDYILDALSI